jgi:hypothetical protein
MSDGSASTAILSRIRASGSGFLPLAAGASGLGLRDADPAAGLVRVERTLTMRYVNSASIGWVPPFTGIPHQSSGHPQAFHGLPVARYLA